MQRNLLFLQQQQQQQQLLARQAQQQRAPAAMAASSGGQVNTLTDPMNTLWSQQQQQQQRLLQQPNATLQQQQLQLENGNRIKQQQLLQQQRLASMYNMQQKETPSQSPPLVQKPSSTTPSTVQPLIPPAHAITVKTKLDQKNLDLYEGRDQHYQRTLDMQHKRHMELAQSKKHEIDMANNERRLRSQSRGILTFGKGYDGYGNGRTSASSHGKVLFPAEKKRKRHHHAAAAAVNLSYQHCMEQANKEDVLVPIRLDLENDGYKIRDTFTWNMNESSITPEQFADITCEDLRLPPTVFSSLISESIKEQIQEYFLNASSMINNDQKDQTSHPYDEFMQCKKQKMTWTPTEDHVKDIGRVELRTLIRLDIIVGNRILNDQFEWDITCEKNSPESFAEAMATDLGLGGEFKTAIAHSIREQVYVFTKSLLLTGYEFGDGPVENEDLRRSFLPAIRNAIRDYRLVERFTPSLIEVTDAEIAKIEKGRTRESRRKRRGVRNRKGAAAILPDREPVPTYRTILASPPEHEMTDDQFLKSMQTTQETATSLHSQRRSAMKARMNIAAEAAGVSLTSGQLVANADVNVSAADQMTHPVASNVMDASWRCADCNCSPFMTTIIRAGPAGDRTLCNACGLYRYKFNSIRPQNYMDKEIKNDIPHLNDWQNYMAKYRA
ncbi:hypothetical protein MAM1_0043d03049 [Mucor ambiguus]|uniref:GATA-type domain-containing protein n=1 Tax=Mucor ambiguus TaxID=91626 RepID=A0A0C9M8U0_9FUNG|nr:hypothetical protein MAM1_0043d03049 [Mucor ambiguus]